MERSIYKYQIRHEDEQVVMLPKGAEILSVQIQSGVLVLWAIVFTKNETEPRVIEIYGTGSSFPTIGQFERKYISTVQDNLGLVWHVFECL